MGLPEKNGGVGWRGRARLLDWPSITVAHSEPDCPPVQPHFVGRKSGGFKVFASKLQKFNLGRITQEDRVEERLSEPGTVPWRQLSLLKCEKLIKAPGFPDETV